MIIRRKAVFFLSFLQGFVINCVIVMYMLFCCKILKKNARIRKKLPSAAKTCCKNQKAPVALAPLPLLQEKTTLPKTNEMKNQNMKLWAALALGAVCALPAQAQKQKAAVKDTVATVQHGASNMMLNASSESEPRFINVGLPEATGGTVVTENGLAVTFDANAVKTNQAWRQDGSFAGATSRNLSETAIKLGEVGVSMITNSKKGGNKFAGVFNLKTNSFGLMSGNLSLSGPLKRGWYYAANAFVNLDPGTTNVNFTRFLDKTQLYKGILTKRYKKGEFNVQYKYATSKMINTKMSPYIYRDGKQVDALDNFDIAHGNYLGNSITWHVKDPLTGEYKDINILDDTGTQTHMLDLFGKHTFDNGMNLDYSFRYQHALSGANEFAYSAITDASNLLANQRYIYANKTTEQVYTGLVQNGTFQYSSGNPVNTVMARLELDKKHEKHHWLVGFQSSYFNADKRATGILTFLQEVAENPQHVIQQELVNGVWTNTKADQYGQWNYNNSMFYYDGTETRNAIYATEQWKILPNLKLDLGARFEWHRINGNWAPGTVRNSWDDKTWISGETQKIKKDNFNKSFTATLTWHILKNFGIIGDAYYIEATDGLSAYKSSNDPLAKTNVVPYFAGGVFFNSKWISVISRVSRISRSNLVASGGFNNSSGENTKLTFNYDIKTVGWTTDANITPFKGFDLHLMLTLQNPVYDNFEFDVFGEHYDYSGLPARITSKTLIEIDPSYQWKKFRVWASARYFSKQSCSYPATLYFPSRWETFAGFDYTHNKHVKFSLNVVNLLNQTGAQGRISGTNTAIDPTPYYDQPVAGTYIRPFTVEFKTQIKF